jgi:hypothetical protein
MAKLTKSKPYHTDSEEYPPEHRNVYHDYEECKDGKRILKEHRINNSTGSKDRCKECIKLDDAA